MVIKSHRSAGQSWTVFSPCVSSGNLSGCSSTVILCPLWRFVLHMGSWVLHDSFPIEHPLSRTPPCHFQACLSPAHSDFHLLSQQDFQDLFGFPFLCPQLEIVWVESREDGRVCSYFLSHRIRPVLLVLQQLKQLFHYFAQLADCSLRAGLWYFVVNTALEQDFFLSGNQQWVQTQTRWSSGGSFVQKFHLKRRVVITSWRFQHNIYCHVITGCELSPLTKH